MIHHAGSEEKEKERRKGEGRKKKEGGVQYKTIPRLRVSCSIVAI